MTAERSADRCFGNPHRTPTPTSPGGGGLRARISTSGAPATDRRFGARCKALVGCCYVRRAVRGTLHWRRLRRGRNAGIRGVVQPLIVDRSCGKLLW